jgi:hypothetical protein
MVNRDGVTDVVVKATPIPGLWAGARVAVARMSSPCGMPWSP